MGRSGPLALGVCKPSLRIRAQPCYISQMERGSWVAGEVVERHLHPCDSYRMSPWLVPSSPRLRVSLDPSPCPLTGCRARRLIACGLAAGGLASFRTRRRESEKEVGRESHPGVTDSQPPSRSIPSIPRTARKSWPLPSAEPGNAERHSGV